MILIKEYVSLTTGTIKMAKINFTVIIVSVAKRIAKFMAFFKNDKLMMIEEGGQILHFVG